MPTDPAPDGVRMAGPDRLAVLKGGAPVVGPGYLPGADPAPNALHSQPFPECAPLQIFDELADRDEKCGLLCFGKVIVVVQERLSLVEGGHRRSYSNDAKNSSSE